tara:strand:+ start:649 stop:1116 length:468 start_codon:yes stop_codon:yes gene_type:complete
MTSTVTAATLTVKITETITLNGSDQGATNTMTIASVNEVMKRIVTCVNGQTTTVLTFNSNAYGAAGALDTEDAKYIRLTNLDDTESVEIAVVTGATLYQVTLRAGESHVLGSPSVCMLAEADTSPSFGTMADLASIQVRPTGSATVDIEVFVAST